MPPRIANLSCFIWIHTLNSSRYCEDLVRTSYPYFFYALFTLPEEKRHAHMAVLSLYHDISNIIYHASDSRISQQKLSFWHEELQRFQQQQARHPITTELQKHCPEPLLIKELLHQLLKGCYEDISAKPILNEHDFQTYTQQHMLVLQKLLLHINAYPDKEDTSFLTPLSLAWEYSATLEKLHLDMKRQRLLLPQSDRIRFKVSDSQLFNAQQLENTQELFSYYAQHIQNLFQQGIEQLPAQHRPILKPLLMMSALYENQAQRILRNPLKVQTEILPLKMMWSAWRSHAKENKINKQLRIQS